MGKSKLYYSNKVFEYTGNNLPMKVVSARFHPSVTKVKNRAFHYRKRLKDVVLNEGLVNIGTCAFIHCESLERIKLPSTVTEVDNSAFMGCTMLREVVLNEGLLKVSHHTFSDCKSLQSITIPSSIVRVDRCAFVKCSELKDVVFNGHLKKIDENTFSRCTSLESITLPSTVTDIGYGAFSDCTSLESITLPSTVTSIGFGAFRNCDSLREVVLNEGLTEIGNYAFYGCSSLISINLPSTLNELGDSAFSNCCNLKEIVLHEEIKYRREWTTKFESLERCKFASISNRLKNIIEAGQYPRIYAPRSLFCGTEQGSPVLHWKDNELILYPKALWRKEVQNGRVKRYLDSIVELITYHEIKEGLTLFELALWNAKMDQADEVMYACERDRYRVGVPGPVKDAIVQYMHGVNIPVPSSHTKMANDSSCEDAASAAKGIDNSSNNENGRDTPTNEVRQPREWHSDNDLNHRREMIQHITKLLKQKDKNASPEWLTKRQMMVEQLEVCLYRSASSLQVYSDTTTLKTRLQQLAMEIAKKRQQAKEVSPGSSGGDSGGGQGSSCSNGQSSRRSLVKKNDGVTSSSRRGGRSNSNDAVRHKQQRLLLLHHSSNCMNEDGKCTVTPYCGEMKKLWKHMASCTDNECRVPHCISSRYILRHHRKCKDPRCLPCGPVRETIRKAQNNQKGRDGNQSGSGGDIEQYQLQWFRC